jgi:DNA-binding NarL/FixJ family response regulator
MAKARTAKSKTRPSLANLTPPPRKKRPESLTSREKEILELIWAGFKNKEIGQRLIKTAIQDGTIKIR